MNYELTKTEKGKQGFQYVVTDEAGIVISSRISKRHYEACTANGSYYFGRLDLIGKGDHGFMLKNTNCPDFKAAIQKIAYLKH